jgi:hypothetical protein
MDREKQHKKHTAKISSLWVKTETWNNVHAKSAYHYSVTNSDTVKYLTVIWDEIPCILVDAYHNFPPKHR